MWAGRVVLLAVMCAVVGARDWTDCPVTCHCKWAGGRKSAFCRHAGFTTIPDMLHSDIQALDLNGNTIPYLTKDAFKSVGLINLQRIYLKGAHIRELHRDAFKDLTILVEVDLSDNSIALLHKETFSGNERLRVLYLNGNPLTELKPSQFPALPHLRFLELQHCQIKSVNKDAFMHLTSLESLTLNGNRLKQLSEAVFAPLSNLKSLSLDGNPWKCDCGLRSFRNWLLASNLYSHPLTCTEPTALANSHWEDVGPLDFACPPAVSVTTNVLQEEPGGNVTFSCKVSGDPEPTVQWLFNSRLVGNSSILSPDQIILTEQDYDASKAEKWTSLSVINVSEPDAGEYTCVAKNNRGQAAVNISLILPEVVIATTLSKSDTWFIWIVWASASTSAVVVTILLTCIICRVKRNSLSNRRKCKMRSSLSFTEQDKKLLDVSITTTTDRQTGSCEGLGSQADIELLEHSLQSISLEVCEPPAHITIESHPTEVGIPVYQPPPEFSSSVLPPEAFGNIFISVSLSQEPTLERYPDLLDLPHRKSVSVGTGPEPPYFATLPRRHRLKEDPLLRVGPQYDNMGPRITACGSSTLSLPDSTAAEQAIPPPPPPTCTPITVEYVSL